MWKFFNAPFWDKIIELNDRIKIEIKDFIEGDKLLKAAEQIEHGSYPEIVDEIPPQVFGYLRHAFPAFRSDDTRIQHVNWLRDLSQPFESVTSDLQSKQNDDDLQEAAERWSRPYRTGMEEVNRQMQAVDAKRHPVWTALGFVAIVMVTLILEAAATEIWNTFSGSISGGS